MHKPETYELKGLNPFNRLGEVKEIVNAVLFLTDATFTTGEILHVDGRAHAGKLVTRESSRLPSAEQRLKELGLNLPTPPQPFGIYAEAAQTGNCFF